MATIAFSVLGSFLGPVGTILGGALGAYVDNRFILPGLFPPKDIIGPRLNELRIQSAEEGAAERVFIGPDNRGSGNVLWCGDLIEVKQSSGGGKGGGGGPEVKSYSYYCSIAIEVCRNQITAIDKIFADGKLIYDDNPNKSVASSVISVDFQTGTALTDYVSPVGGPDLSVFRSGLNILISGCANGSNNGTFKCKGAWSNPDGTSRVRVRNAVGVDETAGAAISISQTIPKFSVDKVENITIYLGTSSQTADPLIEAFEGAGEVPGFRGTAYVVFQNVYLGDYGNRIPQFHFVVKEAVSTTVAAAFQNIISRAKLSLSEIDVTGLTGTVRGYPLTGPIGSGQALQPLMTAYDVLDQEISNSVLKFFHRKNATVVDILESDLSCREFGEDPSEVPIKVKDVRDIDLPSEVRVKYIDYKSNDQSGAQSHRKNFATQRNPLDIDLPLNLTDAGTEAKALAKRTLWDAWVSARTVELSLPPKYLHVLENDVLRLTAFGDIWFLRVEKIDIGGNLLMKLICRVENKDVATQTGESEDPASYLNISSVPPEGEGEPLDIPLIDGGNQTQVPFLYFGATLTDPDKPWTGMEIFESHDGATYHRIRTLFSEATIGFAYSILGVATAASWDEVNTVDVELFKGELESLSELEVLNGHNRILIGNEIIGFKTATLLSTRKYRLSGLIRGVQGTEAYISGHAAGERAILLVRDSIIDHPMAYAAIGTTRYYKFVPPGGTTSDYEAKSVAFAGKSLKPFPVCDIAHTRDGTSKDMVMSFKRRSRAVCKLFTTVEVPNLDGQEVYEVEFWNDALSTLLRTKTVTSPSVTYTGAEQTTDGLSSGSSFKVKIYAVSLYVGRGTVSSTYSVGAV